MLNVGLTGGIASGKSTVARMLVEKGARLIDFDELSHAVEEPDGPVWKEIVRHFGNAILHADRTIDRRQLGDIVFANREKLELLNRLVHPAIFERWCRRMEEIRTVQSDAIVLSDIPLLIEAGMKPMVDLVLLVYIPPEEQLARLMARNGYCRQDAERRIDSQMPIGEKLPFADIVVRNDGSREETRKALNAVWKGLIQRERHLREGTLCSPVNH
jgi:dephospho-CoA kinase